MKSARFMLPLLFGVPLTACQTMNQTPIKPTSPAPVNVQPISMINKTPTISELQSYNWHLLTAKDKHGKTLSGLDLTTYGLKNTGNIINLNFSKGKDNKVGISYDLGCNKMMKAMTYKDGIMTSLNGISISTLMGCGKLNDAERLLNAQMVSSSKLSISVGNDNKATLTQITSDNNILLWEGTLKPEVKYGKGETVFFEVKPTLKPCDTLTGKQCLEVREIKYDNNGMKTATGQWRILHEAIDGYRPEAGVQSVIRVQRYRTPPTDTMGYGNLYVLDAVIESQLIQ